MRILSLDGGGYLGLATAAFLAEAEHHFGAKSHDQFDMFCGTSTGAIIALALANGLSSSDVVDLYRRLGQDVFPSGKWGRKLRSGRSLFTTRYDNHDLKRHLDETFGDTTLDDVHQMGKTVMVTAFSLTSGAPRVFKTDHRPGLTRHGRYRLADLALASAAAPTYFPIVEIKHPDDGTVERYCDGGIVANNPALLGYAEALKVLNVRPANLELLSVSTPRVAHVENQGAASRPRNLRRGVAGWATKLASLFVDAPASVTDGAVGRIVDATGGRYHRIVLQNPACLELDDASDSARTSLERIGRDVAALTSTRAALTPFFT